MLELESPLDANSATKLTDLVSKVAKWAKGDISRCLSGFKSDDLIAPLQRQKIQERLDWFYKQNNFVYDINEKTDTYQTKRHWSDIYLLGILQIIEIYHRIDEFREINHVSKTLRSLLYFVIYPSEITLQTLKKDLLKIENERDYFGEDNKFEFNLLESLVDFASSLIYEEYDPISPFIFYNFLNRALELLSDEEISILEKNEGFNSQTPILSQIQKKLGFSGVFFSEPEENWSVFPSDLSQTEILIFSQQKGLEFQLPKNYNLNEGSDGNLHLHINDDYGTCLGNRPLSQLRKIIISKENSQEKSPSDSNNYVVRDFIQKTFGLPGAPFEDYFNYLGDAPSTLSLPVFNLLILLAADVRDDLIRSLPEIFPDSTPTFEELAEIIRIRPNYSYLCFSLLEAFYNDQYVWIKFLCYLCDQNIITPEYVLSRQTWSGIHQISPKRPFEMSFTEYLEEVRSFNIFKKNSGKGPLEAELLKMAEEGIQEERDNLLFFQLLETMSEDQKNGLVRIVSKDQNYSLVDYLAKKFPFQGSLTKEEHSNLLLVAVDFFKRLRHNPSYILGLILREKRISPDQIPLEFEPDRNWILSLADNDVISYTLTTPEPTKEKTIMSFGDIAKNVGSTVAEGAKDGLKLAAAHEFNMMLSEVLMSIFEKAGVPIEQMKEEPWNTLIQALSPVVMLILCETLGDQIPAQATLHEASKLALQAVSFEKLNPIIASMVPDFVKLTKKAQAVLDPSRALTEGDSSPFDNVVTAKHKVSVA